MLDGSILDTRGWWHINSQAGGISRVVYHVEALLKPGFPEFAVKLAQKKTVKDVVKAVRKQATK